MPKRITPLLALLLGVSTIPTSYGFIVKAPSTMTSFQRVQQSTVYSTVNGGTANNDDHEDGANTVLLDTEEADWKESSTTTTTTTTKMPFESLNPKAIALKKELLELAQRTQKGFRATNSERKKAREIIFDLARYNPTQEPAASYYTTKSATTTNNTITPPSLAGKWNLIYTDAPDITGLDTSQSPFPSTAKLGRIGQECQPPYIKNVIEWKRPDWAKSLPFSGSDNSRILQKVVTLATASPDKPNMVELKVAGLELESGNHDENDNDKNTNRNIVNLLERQGLPAGVLSQNPIDLKGPLNPPFGQFEILYLDDELRIVRTGQNYIAANLRIKDGEEEWF